MNRILESINGPSDLKSLSVPELEQVAAEARSLIIETVGKTGGHLAPNLGVVELTVALLKVFNPPSDKIVWDVGHQTYAYKILTGRRDSFHTLRQHGGISGFQKRNESPYDVFGAGHSGTALSAALGMAVCRDRRGGDEHVVTVLGDGAVGCGISLEALNNVAAATKRLIVVLNDNEMSISRNVGSIAKALGEMLADPRYNRWKGSFERFALGMKLDTFRSVYYRIEEAIKSLFLRSVFFEEFGLRYIGPVDGHNVRLLTDALSIAADYKRPILLHVATRKGVGYSFAEVEPEKWHSCGPFDVASGRALSEKSARTYSEVFGLCLERIAEKDNRIVAITAAMRWGTGLTNFARRFPDRFFDVGISEEHAVVFAAGLAAEGMVPVFAVYSTFMQRAVDCVIHDVCLQNLPVVFCLDRAGIVGDDGPTHHGVFDIALLRPIPGLVLMQPRDGAELADMLLTAVRLGKPAVIRYPRGSGPGAKVPDEPVEIAVGKAEIVRKPGAVGPAPDSDRKRTVWIWALGDMVPAAEEAAELLARRGVAAGVVNARFVRPLDEDLLAGHAAEAGVIATIENGVVCGGFGSAVEESLVGKGFTGRILRFGWPDRFVPQGSSAELMAQFGLTPDAICEAVLK